MKVIIDTSSLLALVRYYLPFDSESQLFNSIKQKIETGNIILVDEVLRECQYTSKKLVVRKLAFLTDKEFKKKNKIPYKTENLIPPSTNKFYNMVENNFRTPYSRKLDDAEFEQAKGDFLKSADARMIILAMIEKNKNNQVAIVTEESEQANDLKAFKKIPAICRELDIEVKTLPELLVEDYTIKIDF